MCIRDRDKYDEVIVPDYTFIASANAVKMTGAKVRLVDIEEENFCLDLEKVVATSRTKAMVYVDLNGRSGNMKRVRDFCKNYDIVLIEDACQALGSKYQGKYLGTFGDFGCFSLNFWKIITTGEGGFVVTHNQEDYEKIERLKNFGRLTGGADVYEEMGFNFKFTDLQAVVGIEQLKTIKKRMIKKRKIYEWYKGKPAPKGYVPYFVELLDDRRDEIFEHLDKNGIRARKSHPPIHTQPVYSNQFGDFPVATRTSQRALWLPSYLKLNQSDINYILERIREVKNYVDV